MWGEFVACYETIIHLVWLNNFVLGLYVLDYILDALMIYCDNSLIVLGVVKHPVAHA